MSYTTRLDNLEVNKIIGGNFDFWQRGTTATLSSATKTYLADRFYSYSSLTNLPTVSQSTDVPTQAQSGYQSRYSMLTTNNATLSTPSAAQIAFIGHRIEGQDYQQIHGRNARLQFWVKSSITGTYGLSFSNSGYTRSYLTTYSIPVAATWTLISVDLPLDTAGSWNFDNTIGLEVAWILSAGTGAQSGTLNAWQTTTTVTVPYAASTSVNWAGTASSTFELAQVMLIPQNYVLAGVGNVVVLFQRAGRSIGHELQMCQRYYESNYEIGVAPGSSATTGRASINIITPSGTATGVQNIVFQTRKRADPTIVLYNQSGTSGTWNQAYGAGSTSSVVANTVSQSSLELAATGSSYTTNGTINLAGFYTADAEL